MNKIRHQEFQEYSEIDLFNKIGFITKTLGYTPVYFKVLLPKFIKTEEGIKLDYKYIHYVRLYKNEDMKISIYYDQYSLHPKLLKQAYYELYDNCNTERFLDTNEDRSNLLIRLSDLV